MSSQQVKLLDHKVAIKAFIVLILVLPLAVYSHEVGHALVCEFYGFESQLSFTLGGASTMCYGQMNHGQVMAYREMGGMFGAIVAVSLLLLANKIAKRSWILAPLFTIALLQGVEMGMETFANDFYMSFGMFVASGVLLFGLVFSLLFYEARLRYR